ncbi:TonB-dependent siderophore receptor [Telluria beijingensis]|uniref:TonB-dependent siderophore receptor n=1 Tax=Telluria beijingensis TaxID=3068633 RepID=UPI0027962ACD|nr:TonB-dependent siderophore receptor [Massilia sp. REN29]
MPYPAIPLAACLLAAVPTLACAADAPARTYRIEAGPLGPALSRFAAASGVALSFDPALARDRQARGLTGAYTVPAGFAALLEDSGLEARDQGNGAWTLQRQPAPAMPSPAPARPAPAARVDARLPTVVITGEAERDGDAAAAGFVARRSSAASKTSTSLLETPQSVSVVTADQIRAQGAQSVEQSVQYTAGTIIGSNGPSTEHDYVFARGFTARQFLDGVGLYASYVSGAQLRIEPYGLERVEVLRGPSSALYGQVEPGGLVNLVSKRPTSRPLREAGLQVGSFDRYQASVDVGGPLGQDGSVSWRLTGLVRESGTQSDFMDNNRRYIAPALAWKIGPQTSLTVLAHYQKDDGGGRAQPLPPEGTLLPNPNGTVPLDRFLGEPGFDGMRREQSSIGYLLEHRFTPATVFRQNGRHSRANMRELFSLVDYYGASWAADLRTVDRYAWDNRNKLSLSGIDNQLETTFATGALQHTLLLGADWRRIRDQWDFYSADEGPLDVFAPVYGQPLGEFAQAIDERTTRRQSGLYLQDQIRWQRWTVTLGARNDRARGGTRDNLGEVDAPLRDDATTWRASLGYLFPQGVALYAGASTSFDPVSGLDGEGRAFEPSKGRQAEAGVKYQPAGSNSLYTLAVFDLRQRNVLTPDPNPPESNPWAQIQTGEIRVRGVEFEAKAQLTRALRLLASYTHFDSEITRSNGADLGREKPYTPRNQAAAWLDYRFDGALAGLELGLGVNRRSAVWGFSYDMRVPSVTLADLALRYPLGQRTQLALNVRNLADKQYVSNCSYADGCVFGERRTAILSLTHGW